MHLEIEKSLHKRISENRLRKLHHNEYLLDFSSNDYLGLARCPFLVTAVLDEWARLRDSSLLNGLGSTGSRLLTGNSCYAEELENRIAQDLGHKAGLLFSSGYMANLGLISCLANKSTVILFDAHVHASIKEGIHLSRAFAFPFRHQDLNHLEHRLKTISKSSMRIICIESVYSMDGSIAP